MKNKKDQHRHSLVTNEERIKMLKCCYGLTINETVHEKQSFSFFPIQRHVYVGELNVGIVDTIRNIL